ncbi:MAG: UPF0179 family protein [Methanophagales archaeon]|nr:UPF0179 family protein [Methanophagales archaeon]
MDGLWNRLKEDVGGETEERKIVTLVGAKLANVGDEFIFLGVSNSKKCEECRLKKSCTNLEVGRRYRIEKVRNEIKHDCYIHEEGVRVVEVIEPSVKVAIEAKGVLKGAKIVFKPADCEETDYELFDLCHPLGLKKGDKCTILDVIGDVPGENKILKGRGLKLVEVKRESK